MKPFHMDEIIKFEREFPNEMAQIRAAIIEECAVVAEEYHDPHHFPQLPGAIAAAIRALKDKP